MNVDASTSRWTQCPCGKRAYVSRKRAKEVAKLMRSTGHLRAYRCLTAPEYWHLGHLADPVIRGDLSATEVYE